MTTSINSTLYCTLLCSTKIINIFTVLLMGFSFALHWAQMAHQSVLEREGVLRRNQLLFDFMPAPQLDHEGVSVVYVDNVEPLNGERDNGVRGIRHFLISLKVKFWMHVRALVFRASLARAAKRRI